MPQAASWVGTPSIRGSSESLRMALLTFSLLGLQFTWGIEMTYCTPYLLQLGLSKSRTSMVWVAGPLSGLVMQPIVGVITDRSKSKWGRRRPFMILGSLVVALCLVVLGWTSEIVSIFIVEEKSKKTATVALAVLSIYAVDFAINAVQSSCRSLIVDTLPIPKQQLGAAWASRMTATGHVIGYVAGTVDLVSTLGKFMGDTQFKQLCVISATSLLFTQCVTSYCVTERVLVANGGTGSNSGAIKTLAQILKTTLHLPKRIQAICWTQFWAWIGWFPFLFYSSTWVGETYFRYSAPADAKKSADALGDIGRVGSLSLVVFSVLAFVGSTALPWLVRSPEDEKPGFRPPVHLPSAIRNAYQFKPDLLTTWMVANLMFAVAMSMAPFVRSVGFATVLVALCGLPWAVACWAPFSLIGVEINRLGAGPASARAYHRISTDSVPDALHLDDYDESAPAPSSSTGELAGIYLGILNVFTTLPQFVGTFIAGIVFSILEPGTSPELAGDENAESHANVEGVNAISVCLFIGALSALVAAYSTTRLRAALQQ